MSPEEELTEFKTRLVYLIENEARLCQCQGDAIGVDQLRELLAGVDPRNKSMKTSK